MIKISHRGNTHGPSKNENNPRLINELLNNNINVEVDVWLDGNDFYLGHDFPEYRVRLIWLKHKNLWLHCKNLDALIELKGSGTNYFWHQTDDYTLTSKKFIWTYPGKCVTDRSVIVDLSITPDFSRDCYGVCCDYF